DSLEEADDVLDERIPPNCLIIKLVEHAQRGLGVHRLAVRAPFIRFERVAKAPIGVLVGPERRNDWCRWRVAEMEGEALSIEQTGVAPDEIRGSLDDRRVDRHCHNSSIRVVGRSFRPHGYPST